MTMSVTFALVTALPCHAWPTPTHEHGSLMVISRIDRLFGLELKAAARELFPFLSELLWYLGTPIAWIWQLVRLILFVIVLLPFFLPPTIKYALSSRVHKGMRYGPSVRHAVDVYVPESAPADSATGTPVVIFVSGGAWIIGYRMWGFVMGLAMQQRGILFVSVDYRNFPQSRMPEMVDDISSACAWVWDNVAEYGGDPENVTLVGQSAGAHLGALLLLRLVGISKDGDIAVSGASHAVKAAAVDPPSATATATTAATKRLSFRRWIGISGPYDLVKLVPALRQRGLHPGLMSSLACGDLPACSPSVLLAQRSSYTPPATSAPSSGHASGAPLGAMDTPMRWPPLALFHGTADRTVDWHHSVDFAEALRAAGAPDVSEEYFADKSHTDPILEDPLLSGADPLLEQVVRLVLGAAGAAVAASASPTPSPPRHGPHALVRRAASTMTMLGLRPLMSVWATWLRVVHRVAKFVNPF